MNKDEALKLALEALEYIEHNYMSLPAPAEKAITAIKEVLAQPEQEPVVWMYQDKSTHEVRFQKHMRDFVDHGATYETPLYTTPQQRTWQGLTDADLAGCDEFEYKAACYWEAKLKEKNA